MLLLVLVDLLLFCKADFNSMELQHMFSDFKSKFSLDFGKDDEKREAIFQDNVRYINKVNAQNLSFHLSINKFAHLTREEFRDMMGLGGILNPRTAPFRARVNPDVRPFTFEGEADDLPMKVDWRDKGYVTPVKNQGKCGSCWAFSATGALEALHKNMTGNLVSLSEQELVDCSGSYGNDGCGGGDMSNAFQYVGDNGLESEATYPYIHKDDACHSTNDTDKEIKAGTIRYRDIEHDSENSLQAAVANHGPVSVGIQADTTIFQFYKDGIIDSTDCGTDLDHGVLVVGFVRVDSSSTDLPYFIVKNSWGADWGDEGYVRIMSNGTDGGICGILMDPSIPLKK